MSTILIGYTNVYEMQNVSKFDSILWLTLFYIQSGRMSSGPSSGRGNHDTVSDFHSLRKSNSAYACEPY